MTEQPAEAGEPRAPGSERAVLGIALASARHAEETVRSLRPADFYEPAHQAIFDALTHLVDARKPTDPISTWAQVEAGGNDRVVRDGPLYLAELMTAAPAGAALTHHLGLVRDASARRAVARLGVMSQSLAASKTSGSAAALLEAIRERLDSISTSVIDDEIPTLASSMEAALAEVERLGQGGALVGIPTGFPDLDAKLHGVRPGQMIMIAGRPAMGKALALDTPLPAPGGTPTTMGAVRPGDAVLGPDGQPVRVVAATEPMHGRPCYRVAFSDGAVIVADAEHLWVTDAREPAGPAGQPVTTEQIARTLRDRNGRWNHQVTRCPAGDAPITRTIVGVQPVDSVPVRCIQVDSPDGLFLAGPTGIPTHNSTLMLDVVRSASLMHGKSSLVFSLEMSRQELVMRLLSAQARVELAHLQTGAVPDDEWERLDAAFRRIKDARLGIDDSPGTTIADIRAKARGWQAKHGLDLLAIDYLQLMNSHRRVESRQQEVSEISRNVKLLAKELGVPVLALSQLNRGAEQRTDKRPMLSDLRESGSLEQDSDVVILVHREEVYNPESRVGEGDFIIAKHRGGPTGVIPVVAQLHYSRFVPAAFPSSEGS